MDGDDEAPRSRRRLAEGQRRAEILAAAAQVIDAQGFLPIPFDQVARGAGVSKGLVYAYFPNQAALCNAVLRRGTALLKARFEALETEGFETNAIAHAQHYFDDAAEHGALLHILFTDQALDGARDPAAMAWRDAQWRRLVRAARAYAPLKPRERIAALAIILSIPEETARLARRGEMETARARDLCADLVLSALRGLRGLKP